MHVRLLQTHVPVFGNHEHGYNTVADISRADPTLRDQIAALSGLLLRLQSASDFGSELIFRKGRANWNRQPRNKMAIIVAI